jgi:membrane protein implicated in regulation of membrane protease activity
MCHVVLVLPFLAWPVFWLLPLPEAASLYAMTLVAAAAVYGYAFKSARMPRLNGAEGMIGEQGRVVKRTERGVTVSIHGELWSAEASGDLPTLGDEVLVEGIDGLRLRVTSAASGTRAAPARPGAAGEAPRPSAQGSAH